jgi:endonuclease III
VATRRNGATLAARLDALERLQGAPRAALPSTPFEWILWENVAYLVPDERRERAYRALAAQIGLDAESVGRASDARLLAVTKLGGMHPEARVERLQECAAIARENGGGGLESVLRLPLPAARKVLKLFPGIGAPGADKILLACGATADLALESNGLRVLVRLGYAAEKPGYAATYRAVLLALLDERPRDAAGAWRAHQLLRVHGARVCKRTAPLCGACPLARDCAACAGAT